MHCDVISCVIGISHKVEYFEKKRVREIPLLKFKDATTLSFLVIFAMQSVNSCTKFRFIGNLRVTTKFL